MKFLCTLSVRPDATIRARHANHPQRSSGMLMRKKKSRRCFYANVDKVAKDSVRTNQHSLPRPRSDSRRVISRQRRSRSSPPSQYEAGFRGNRPLFDHALFQNNIAEANYFRALTRSEILILFTACSNPDLKTRRLTAVRERLSVPRLRPGHANHAPGTTLENPPGPQPRPPKIERPTPTARPVAQADLLTPHGSLSK